MLNIRCPKLNLVIPVILSVHFVCADVSTIEDFYSYTDASSMQANATTFGSADKMGLSTLDQGEGIDSSNIAYLNLGAFYDLAFNISSNDTKRVTEKNEPFRETIADIESIRFRFDNNVQAGVSEDAYIVRRFLPQIFQMNPMFWVLAFKAPLNQWSTN